MGENISSGAHSELSLNGRVRPTDLYFGCSRIDQLYIKLGGTGTFHLQVTIGTIGDDGAIEGTKLGTLLGLR